MKADRLTVGERQLLLRIAREAITCIAAGQKLLKLELSNMPVRLQEQGAAFVTLTLNDLLRGCIGALQASQPLALDVQEHAAAAASEDYRFPPVQSEEVDQLVIEISRLSPSRELAYTDADDLAEEIAPGRGWGGAARGFQRATFLPQVWANIPDPVDFLTQLCHKWAHLVTFGSGNTCRCRPTRWKNLKNRCMERYEYEC